MEEKPVGGADEVDDQPSPAPGAELDAAAPVVEASAPSADEAEAEAAIVDLPWDEDLPVALGQEDEDPVPVDGLPSKTERDDDDRPAAEDDVAHDERAVDDLDDLDDDDRVAAPRNALPRRVESWRTRSASGAIATAIAMGLQQVFEPERRRPAAVAEAPSDPYADDDPVTVDYVPDDAEATRVHVKPWLLQKGDPT